MLIYQHTKYDDMSSMLGQDFVAAQPALRSFESVAGYMNDGDQNLTGAGAPMRVSVIRVTANFFPTLRVSPALGRFFLSSEDVKDGPAVVILSHRLWQSRLNSDPSIIGRTITLAGSYREIALHAGRKDNHPFACKRASTEDDGLERMGRRQPRV